MNAFWAVLEWVNSLSPPHICEVLSQSTHSQVFALGNCADAFRFVLYAGAASGLAWVIVS